MFEREGWKEFRTLDGLCRMAGVGRDKIGAVVAKELVDNALDESSSCIVGLLSDNIGFFVQDNGPGIDLDEVADLFSIGRQQKSTKFLRLPTRGALGNGLRVVASAVLVTKGKLIVSTRGQVMNLIPRDDGTTKKEVINDHYDGAGTRVEVCLGSDAGRLDERTLRWARDAIRFAGGQRYNGKTSGHW
jgi:DNA topoisomerase VI subunit B